MSNKETTLLNSLIDYVNDVKPYHTKFREVSSEIFFADKMNVSFKETHSLDAYFQNIWTRDDIGGESLYRLSDGQDFDRTFKLPPTVYPRFTDFKHLGSAQVPVELTFTAVPEIVSSVNDGFTVNVVYRPKIQLGYESIVYGFSEVGATFYVNGSVYEGTYTKTGSSIVLNQDFTFTDVYEAPEITLEKIASILKMVVKIQYVNTGRYSVPHHQGSSVKVNAVDQVLSVDYVVDKSHSFIQFLPGKYPAANSVVDIKIFRSDRLFISIMSPFDYAFQADQGYDMYNFDQQPYDSGFCDTFTVTINDALHNKAEVAFFDSVPGKVKGSLNVTNVVMGPENAQNGDTYLVTAVGAWSFTVQKVYPELGPIQRARFMTQFSDGNLTFTIERNWSQYYITDHEDYYSYLIEQDNHSYLAFDELPFDTTDSSDPSEFYSDHAITTEHGVVTDPASPLHHPVRYANLGVVKKKTKNTLIGEQDYYVFELDSVPTRDSYVELRIDQTGQYNPMVNVNFIESLEIKDLGGVDEYYIITENEIIIDTESGIHFIPESVTDVNEFYVNSEDYSSIDTELDIPLLI